MHLARSTICARRASREKRVVVTEQLQSVSNTAVCARRGRQRAYPDIRFMV
jgi:hypothetical protein